MLISSTQVMVWNQLARGDGNYCAVLVVMNSVLQVILYSPYALLFVNVLGGSDGQIHVSYSSVAISVLIVSFGPYNRLVMTEPSC
jgi:arsenite transporter